ncbi:MAG: homoserine kinase [Thermoplasmata archaeon]|nr:homoserine kinase [Thermoplasmata archaeon]
MATKTRARAQYSRRARPTSPELPTLPFSLPSRRGRPKLTISVPYSIANVGPGFDRLGLCLDGPQDVLEIENGGPEHRFQIGGSAGVSAVWERNVAGIAYQSLFRRSGVPLPPSSVRLSKGFRSGTGLGSSGASAVAGALGAAFTLGLRLRAPSEVASVLAAAADGERAAAGAPHFDNVAASLFGGFIAIESLDPLRIVRLPAPPALSIALAVPTRPISTSDSRRVVPREVPLGDVVANLGKVSGIVGAFARGDVRAIGQNLEDRVAARHRESLVPGLSKVRQAAIDAGAFGAALSGSGPAVFALAPARRIRAVTRAMVQAFEHAGEPADGFEARSGTGPSVQGAR